MVENVAMEGMSFEQAIVALKEGSKIRRINERKGYVKMVITENKKTKEKFGTYWLHHKDSISDYCSFEIKDMLANDWIIDEQLVGTDYATY